MNSARDYQRNGTRINSNVLKVRIHRVKKFLKNLVTQLDKNFHSYEGILKDSIKTARSLFSLREEVTIVETGLVGFWLTLNEKGIQKFSIKQLITLAKEDLNRNVSAGRILKLISKVKAQKGGFKPIKDLKEVLHKLFLRILRGDLKEKLTENIDNTFSYTATMQEELQKTIETLKKKQIILTGRSRKVISAIIFYILDKIISKKMGITPVFSAKEIGSCLGVSQYTILRKYKDFIKLLERNEDLDKYF